MNRKKTFSALQLLDRPSESAYIEGWTDLLAKPKEQEETEGCSVIIFRLGGEWLALDTAIFNEIVSERNVHTIPHRSNNILRGVVNFNGQLTLCVNMHNFLDVAKPEETEEVKQKAFNGYGRMMAIQNENEKWLFSVDQVFGVYRCEPSQLGNIPVTVFKTKTNYLRGLIKWKEMNVGYLDDELLFYGLKRSLS